INEKPTGSKDPYALRRAALGVIRLILDNNVRVSLRGVLEGANFRNVRRAYLVGQDAAQEEALDNILAGVDEGVALKVWSQKSDKIFDELNQKNCWGVLSEGLTAFFADRLTVLL